MADFIRGAASFAFGVSRSSLNTKEKVIDKDKEKLHPSPSPGSDDNNVELALEDFDPFMQAENDETDAADFVALIAPPEKE